MTEQQEREQHERIGKQIFRLFEDNKEKKGSVVITYPPANDDKTILRGMAIGFVEDQWNMKDSQQRIVDFLDRLEPVLASLGKESDGIS